MQDPIQFQQYEFLGTDDRTRFNNFMQDRLAYTHDKQYNRSPSPIQQEFSSQNTGKKFGNIQIPQQRRNMSLNFNQQFLQQQNFIDNDAETIQLHQPDSISSKNYMQSSNKLNMNSQQFLQPKIPEQDFFVQQQNQFVRENSNFENGRQNSYNKQQDFFQYQNQPLSPRKYQKGLSPTNKSMTQNNDQNYYKCSNFSTYISYMTKKIGKYNTEDILNSFRISINQQQPDQNGQYTDNNQNFSPRQQFQENDKIYENADPMSAFRSQNLEKDFDNADYKNGVFIIYSAHFSTVEDLEEFLEQINNTVYEEHQLSHYFKKNKMSFFEMQNTFEFSEFSQFNNSPNQNQHLEQQLSNNKNKQRIYIPGIVFSKLIYLPKIASICFLLLNYNKFVGQEEGEYMLVFHKSQHLYEFINQKLKTFDKETQTITGDQVYFFFRRELRELSDKHLQMQQQFNHMIDQNNPNSNQGNNNSQYYQNHDSNYLTSFQKNSQFLSSQQQQPQPPQQYIQSSQYDQSQNLDNSKLKNQQFLNSQNMNSNQYLSQSQQQSQQPVQMLLNQQFGSLYQSELLNKNQNQNNMYNEDHINSIRKLDNQFYQSQQLQNNAKFQQQQQSQYNDMGSGLMDSQKNRGHILSFQDNEFSINNNSKIHSQQNSMLNYNSQQNQNQNLNQSQNQNQNQNQNMNNHPSILQQQALQQSQNQNGVMLNNQNLLLSQKQKDQQLLEQQQMHRSLNNNQQQSQQNENLMLKQNQNNDQIFLFDENQIKQQPQNFNNDKQIQNFSYLNQSGSPQNKQELYKDQQQSQIQSQSSTQNQNLSQSQNNLQQIQSSSVQAGGGSKIDQQQLLKSQQQSQEASKIKTDLNSQIQNSQASQDLQSPDKQYKLNPALQQFIKVKTEEQIQSPQQKSQQQSQLQSPANMKVLNLNNENMNQSEKNSPSISQSAVQKQQSQQGQQNMQVTKSQIVGPQIQQQQQSQLGNSQLQGSQFKQLPLSVKDSNQSPTNLKLSQQNSNLSSPYKESEIQQQKNFSGQGNYLLQQQQQPFDDQGSNKNISLIKSQSNQIQSNNKQANQLSNISGAPDQQNMQKSKFNNQQDMQQHSQNQPDLFKSITLNDQQQQQQYPDQLQKNQNQLQNKNQNLQSDINNKNVNKGNTNIFTMPDNNQPQYQSSIYNDPGFQKQQQQQQQSQQQQQQQPQQKQQQQQQQQQQSSQFNSPDKQQQVQNQNIQQQQNDFKAIQEKLDKAKIVLTKGKVFLKFGQNDTFGPQRRKIYFSDNLLNFQWCKENQQNRKQTTKIFKLAEIIKITEGSNTPNFQKKKVKQQSEEQQRFSIICDKRSVDLQALNLPDKQEFVGAVNTLIEINSTYVFDVKCIITGLKPKDMGISNNNTLSNQKSQLGNSDNKQSLGQQSGQKSQQQPLQQQSQNNLNISNNNVNNSNNKNQVGSQINQVQSSQNQQNSQFQSQQQSQFQASQNQQLNKNQFQNQNDQSKQNQQQSQLNKTNQAQTQSQFNQSQNQNFNSQQTGQFQNNKSQGQNQNVNQHQLQSFGLSQQQQGNSNANLSGNKGQSQFQQDQQQQKHF